MKEYIYDFKLYRIEVNKVNENGNAATLGTNPTAEVNKP